MPVPGGIEWRGGLMGLMRDTGGVPRWPLRQYDVVPEVSLLCLWTSVAVWNGKENHLRLGKVYCAPSLPFPAGDRSSDRPLLSLSCSTRVRFCSSSVLTSLL